MMSSADLEATTSASVERVRQALAAANITAEIKFFDSSTRTAADAAEAIGCTVAQIAKSLVFRAVQTDRPILIIASGSNRVDTAKVAAVLGEDIGKADADFVRRRTGFAIGGVSPIGHIDGCQVIIDRDLEAFTEIWAAAGSPNAVFRLTPAQLKQMTGGWIADIKA